MNARKTCAPKSSVEEARLNAPLECPFWGLLPPMATPLFDFKILSQKRG
jgi:hypothetical protein